MRTKFVAALLACSVAATGLLGLTACGPEDEENEKDLTKGEQVTEAKWKEAIAATANAQNFTATMTQSQIYHVGPASAKEELNVKSYNDLFNNKIYYESETSFSEPSQETQKILLKSYSELDGLTVWSAMKDDASTGWDATSETYDTAAEMKEALGEITMTYCLTDETLAATANGQAKSVYDLYSSFTYQNGIYTATLHRSEAESATATVSISVLKGYVIGMQLYTSAQEGAMTVENSLVFTFGKFSETSLQGVVAPEAVQSLKAYRQENGENGGNGEDEDDKEDVNKDVAAGNIYEFDTCYFIFDDSVPKDFRDLANQQLPMIRAQMAGSLFVFRTNGEFINEISGAFMKGTYTQRENTITATVNGAQNTITLENGVAVLSNKASSGANGDALDVTSVVKYRYKNHKADAYNPDGEETKPEPPEGGDDNPQKPTEGENPAFSIQYSKYLFHHAEVVEYYAGITDEEKKALYEQVASYGESMSGVIFEFNEKEFSKNFPNGVSNHGSYELNGETVRLYVGDDCTECHVNDKELRVREYDEMGNAIEYVYINAKYISGGDEGNNEGVEVDASIANRTFRCVSIQAQAKDDKDTEAAELEKIFRGSVFHFSEDSAVLETKTDDVRCYYHQDGGRIEISFSEPLDREADFAYFEGTKLTVALSTKRGGQVAATFEII